MSLNNYPLEELEVLLDCIHQGRMNLPDEYRKLVDKWADRVVDAISDAKFEEETLNF